MLLNALSHSFHLDSHEMHYVIGLRKNESNASVLRFVFNHSLWWTIIIFACSLLSLCVQYTRVYSVFYFVLFVQFSFIVTTHKHIECVEEMPSIISVNIVRLQVTRTFFFTWFMCNALLHQQTNTQTIERSLVRTRIFFVRTAQHLAQQHTSQLTFIIKITKRLPIFGHFTINKNNWYISLHALTHARASHHINATF